MDAVRDAMQAIPDDLQTEVVYCFFVVAVVDWSFKRRPNFAWEI